MRLVCILVLLLPILALAQVSLGAVPIPMRSVLAALVQPEGDFLAGIVRQQRLPRVGVAIFVGACNVSDRHKLALGSETEFAVFFEGERYDHFFHLAPRAVTEQLLRILESERVGGPVTALPGTVQEDQQRARGVTVRRGQVLGVTQRGVGRAGRVQGVPLR